MDHASISMRHKPLKMTQGVASCLVGWANLMSLNLINQLLPMVGFTK